MNRTESELWSGPNYDTIRSVIDKRIQKTNACFMSPTAISGYASLGILRQSWLEQFWTFLMVEQNPKGKPPSAQKGLVVSKNYHLNKLNQNANKVFKLYNFSLQQDVQKHRPNTCRWGGPVSRSAWTGTRWRGTRRQATAHDRRL